MSIDDLGVVTVVSIVIICYLIGLICKQIKFIEDSTIPCIVGLFGAILGVVGMYVIPNFPAQDILNAIAVGIVSGLASTGVHQVYKQISKKDDDATA